MEGIEKLREYGHECCARVDDTIRDLADEIEREIAERYMELPLDADGVPVHVGDEMELDNERFVVCAVAPGRVHRWDIHNIGELDRGTVAYPPDSLHHFKPRNLEDVLDEFASAYDRIGGEDDEHWKYLEIVKRYADEIRELLGVDA